MTSLSLLAGMTVKVDREDYPLIIAVSLNSYQYVYKRSKDCPRLKPVTTSLRVMFASRYTSRYTIKVVARSCRFFVFRFIFRFSTISCTVYTIIHSEFGF